MKWLLSIPLHLVGLAAVFALGYLIVDFLGWRETTAILSGTFPTADRWWDAMRCACYLAFYFAFVVASPILLIAAAVLVLLERVFLARAPK